MFKAIDLGGCESPIKRPLRLVHSIGHEKDESLRARKVISELRGDQVSFPHREVSISHSQGEVVVGQMLGAKGFGVDCEVLREFDPKVAKVFLTSSEVKRFNPESKEEVLRLWVLKEAIFKADLNNSGKVLRDYEIKTLDSIEDRLSHGPGKWMCQGVAEQNGVRYECLALRRNNLFIGIAYKIGE